MTDKQKLIFCNLIKRCQSISPDNDRLIKAASYDRSGERLAEAGKPLHLDYIIIGDACFIINKKEKEVLEAFLNGK